MRAQIYRQSVSAKDGQILWARHAENSFVLFRALWQHRLILLKKDSRARVMKFGGCGGRALQVNRFCCLYNIYREGPARPNVGSGGPRVSRTTGGTNHKLRYTIGKHIAPHLIAPVVMRYDIHEAFFFSFHIWFRSAYKRVEFFYIHPIKNSIYGEKHTHVLRSTEDELTMRVVFYRTIFTEAQRGIMCGRKLAIVLQYERRMFIKLTQYNIQTCMNIFLIRGLFNNSLWLFEWHNCLPANNYFISQLTTTANIVESDFVCV